MKPDMFLKLSFALMIAGFAMACYFIFSYPNISDRIPYSIFQLLSLPFIVTGIVELNSSDRIDRKEKIMWTFGFVALTLITGILYFISQRKRVIPV